jgi:predicted DNA-binding protein YlxM (UPF0122 family)
MAKVASREKRIADIALMLEQGMERKKILQKIAKTCKVSARTVDDDIKAAKLVLHSRNQQKEAIRQAQTTESMQKAINEAILSDMEIEAILCNVIKGNISTESILGENVIIKGVTHSDIINAAKVIYAKRGSNAPTKQEIEHKGTIPVQIEL